MSIKIEMPIGALVMTRNDLKEVMRELTLEVHEENATDSIMTIKETAIYLKVSVPTVRNMISNREIPHFKRGQVIRLHRSDVRAWIRKEMDKEGVQ
jgi:excisionase family DNA binding protein